MDFLFTRPMVHRDTKKLASVFVFDYQTNFARHNWEPKWLPADRWEDCAWKRAHHLVRRCVETQIDPNHRRRRGHWWRHGVDGNSTPNKTCAWQRPVPRCPHTFGSFFITFLFGLIWRYFLWLLLAFTWFHFLLTPSILFEIFCFIWFYAIFYPATFGPSSFIRICFFQQDFILVCVRSYLSS